jgi:hypothetical protein
VAKYLTAGQATDDNIIRRMRFACWITKTTDTHLEYKIQIAFRVNNGYAKAPKCSVFTCIACLVHLNII